MLRLIVSAALVGLLLSGCTAKIVPPSVTCWDAGRRFGIAMDQLDSAAGEKLLRTLSQDCPASPWSARAEAVLRHVANSEQADQQCAELEQAQKSLQLENQQLEEKIEQLTKLLVDSESRAQNPADCPMPSR